MKTCSICGETFENGRVYSNHVRWAHKVKIVKCKFCGKEFSCGIKQHEDACMLNPQNIKYCKQCGNKLLDYNKEFCDSSCAATYHNSHRNFTNYKKKISYCKICGKQLESIINAKVYCKECWKEQNKIKNKQYTIICKKLNENKHVTEKLKKHVVTKTFDCKCVICKKEFKHFRRKVKTCSADCYHKLLSITSKANPNCGGETNYKKYRYNGIYMDSTWELEIAKWLDDNNIEWKRSRKIMFWWTDKNGNKRRYYPDFYLPKYNLYLDPKNPFLLQKDKFKLDQVIRENNVNLIYGNKDFIMGRVVQQENI